MPNINPANTRHLSIYDQSLEKKTAINYLNSIINRFNSDKMKQSVEIDYTQKAIRHKITANVKYITILPRHQKNSPLMMRFFTINRFCTFQANGNNHPYNSEHIGEFQIQLNKHHGSKTLNPFTGHRIKLSKDLDATHIDVTYQTTFLGIPFNRNAANVEVSLLNPQVEPIRPYITQQTTARQQRSIR